MRLWTTQTQAFWDQLQDQGRISCESEYAESLFLTYYDWLSGQMCRRIGPPPESGIRFPIWAWKQQGSHKKPCRPSPPSSGNLDQEVFLTIDVPDEKVLLSDFDLWGNCVLNDFYIPADKADNRRFDKMEDRLRRAGIPAGEWPEDVKAEIRRSWERIFDLDHPCHYQHLARRNRWIQATFWELKRDWVVDCRPLDNRIIQEET